MKDLKYIFSTRRLAAALVFVVLIVIGSVDSPAQTSRKRNRELQPQQTAEISSQKTAADRHTPNNGTAIGPDGKPFIYMHYRVIKGDTVFVEKIRPSKCYSRLPRQKSKEWRKYYRLVHNFAKTYPYALIAKEILMEADSTITTEDMNKRKKNRYVSKLQGELFSVFEKPLKNLTITQGQLLLKLIQRETGILPYDIIKTYKSKAAAGFWQGIAKMFGTDLKKPYDPEGEDKEVEELVKIWEAGDFNALYFSLFWKDAPEMPIPEKYL